MAGCIYRSGGLGGCEMLASLGWVEGEKLVGVVGTTTRREVKVGASSISNLK